MRTHGAGRRSAHKQSSWSTRTGSHAQALLVQRVWWSAARATKEDHIRRVVGVCSVRLAMNPSVCLLAMRSALPRSAPLRIGTTRLRLWMGERGILGICNVTKAMLCKGARLPASQMGSSQANRNASRSHALRSTLSTGCLRIAQVALATSAKCNVHLLARVQTTAPSAVARTARSQEGLCVTVGNALHVRRRLTMHSRDLLVLTHATMV